MIKEKYIKLLDVIFNEMFEDNSYGEKWKKFDSVATEIENFKLRDFVDNCSDYLKSHRGFDVNISGIARIINDFPVFSTSGIYNYLLIKEKQVKNVLNEDGILSSDNTREIFEKLNHSAVKQIINDCIEKKIIESHGKAFEDNKIIFERIVPFIENKNSYNNYIFNSGTMNNISQGININDDKLYSLVNSKIDLIKKELGKEYNKKIDELVTAVNNKNKKSVLTTLSELATIGSVIAAGIISIVG